VTAVTRPSVGGAPRRVGTVSRRPASLGAAPPGATGIDERNVDTLLTVIRHAAGRCGFPR
jgi:hypothetical protein